MTVLRKSPWYQAILREGLAQGLEQGLERGREEGREEGIRKGRRDDILHVLHTRFYLLAEAATEITDRLEQIEANEVLQQLLLAAAQIESLAAFTDLLDEEEQGSREEKVNPKSKI